MSRAFRFRRTGPEVTAAIRFEFDNRGTSGESSHYRDVSGFPPATLVDRRKHDDHLGIILLVLGFVFSIPVLWTIGLILVAVGVVLLIIGTTGRAIAGRRYWY